MKKIGKAHGGSNSVADLERELLKEQEKVFEARRLLFALYNQLPSHDPTETNMAVEKFLKFLRDTE